MTDAGATRSAVLALALAAVALGARTPDPWTGAAFLATWAVFASAGLATVRLAFPAPAGPLVKLVMATAHGVGSAVVVWTVSALAFKRLGPGTVALVGLSVVGLWRARSAWKGRTPFAPGEAAAAASTLIAALALGLYVNGFNEIQKGDALVFTFRFDWPSHLYWAQLVKERGLPLVGGSGVATVPFAALTHTGLLCLVAGIQELAGVGPYGAARILGVGGFPLLALAGWAGAGRAASGRSAVLAGLSTLVWGGIGAPLDLLAGNTAGILDPYLGGIAPLAVPSGALYHNLTQLLSVALAAAALCAVDASVTGRAPRGLLLAGSLLGAAWLLKPSTPLVLMPALVLACLVARVPFRGLVALCAPFAAALALYYLPAALAPLPPGPRFAMRLPAADTPIRLLIWLGLTAVVAGRALRRLPAPPPEGAATGALALALLAGIVIEACVFEPRLPAYGNNVWSLAAVLVLLAPGTVATAIAWTRRSAFSGARLLPAVLLVAHVGTGVLYLVRYPWIRPRQARVASRRALEAVHEATPRDRRILLDLALVPTAACPYVGRQTPLPMVPLIQPEEGADLAQWLGVNRGAEPDARALDGLLAGCGGVVLGPQTRHLRGPLRARGWTAEDIALPAPYRLFKPPPERSAAGR